MKDPITKLRFLYNTSYGMATDSNSLYYLRDCYYNPDIKRFINQDIKVGDIGSSQSLNRYAYCEGNPVSMVDPFGLCGENPNDQGKESKYQFWHNVLDVAGLFFDVADVVNAAIYAYEKDWTNAAICAASAIPAVGAAVIGVAKSAKAVIKAKKAEKIASLAAEASRLTKNAANTLDTFSDTMRIAEKYGKSAIKSADNIISEAGSKVIKAMETGGDIGKEASKAVKSAETAVSAGGLRLSTKVDEGANLLKQGFAGADGVAKGAGFSIPTKQQMHDAVTQWARMEESLADSHRKLDKFNTASVVYDSATGSYFYGMNRGIQLSGDNLNSSLKSWLPDTTLNKKYKIGNCAEVDAVNQALNSGANITDLYMYTIDTKKNIPKPMCANCRYTFLGKVADIFSE